MSSARVFRPRDRARWTGQAAFKLHIQRNRAEWTGPKATLLIGRDRAEMDKVRGGNLHIQRNRAELPTWRPAHA